ncbi:MAG: hypothetical protein EU539_06200, partial [Promethearchaeota archaeon]
MSYIEKKYKENIWQTFGTLVKLEENLTNLLTKKSLKEVDEVAKLCAEFNKKINQILKKYYPEIKNMDDKLKIKSTLKFYYDLIDKLTDFIRNVENFQQLDDEYYNALIKFIQQKDMLISGKYKQICANELTAFYDKKSRANLEKIIAEKFEKQSREFFTVGPLEEEIKKIAKIAGAGEVIIKRADATNFSSISDKARSIIQVGFKSDQAKTMGIIEELKKYIESK